MKKHIRAVLVNGKWYHYFDGKLIGKPIGDAGHCLRF